MAVRIGETRVFGTTEEVDVGTRKVSEKCRTIMFQREERLLYVNIVSVKSWLGVDDDSLAAKAVKSLLRDVEMDLKKS